MTNAHDREIVIGLDDTPPAWRALDWAIDEAERTGRTLVIAHYTTYPVVTDDAANRLLAAAAGRAADHGVAARTETRPGDAAERLNALARSAALLVLGRRHRGLPEILLGSVGRRVVGHAPCPTVVVGAGMPLTGSRVVVGVSDTAGGVAALRFACSEARRRAGEVQLVRSYAESPYVLGATAMAVPVVMTEDWAPSAQRLVDRCIALLQEEFPDLTIGGTISALPVPAALDAASRDAALLVTGCRHADRGVLPRLGPHAAWAVRSAPCPVAVVGHDRAARGLTVHRTT